MRAVKHISILSREKNQIGRYTVCFYLIKDGENSKKWARGIPGNLKKDTNRQCTKYVSVDPSNGQSRSMALVLQKRWLTEECIFF